MLTSSTSTPSFLVEDSCDHNSSSLLNTSSVSSASSSPVSSSSVMCVDSPSPLQSRHKKRLSDVILTDNDDDDEDSFVYTARPLSDLTTATTDFKVVHFIRHAQGQHNLAVAMKGGDKHEYENWAWLDSRLTDLGKSQASALRPTMSQHKVDVVLTSSLSRTIQTGMLAIPPGPRFEVVDDLRERIGQHPCDKRRSKSELALDFPDLDLSNLDTEEDERWSVAREPLVDLVARAERVCDVLRKRKETHIAVVTHNDFLQALLMESSRLQVTDVKLRRFFGNAEHLAVVLTWERATTDVLAELASRPREVRSTLE